eukprot:jgi/Undpi1/4027/HiC_scaffold_16.g07394.m1
MSIVRAAVIATGRASTLRTSISMNHLLRHQQQHAGALCSAMSTLGKGPASSQAAPAVSPEASSTAARLDGGGGGAGMASRSIGTKKKIGEKVAGEEIRPGARSQVHFRATANKHPLGLGPSQDKKGKEWSMPAEIWSDDELNSIQVTHKEPEEAVDHFAYRGVRFLRWSFDVLAGFKTGVVDEHKYLNRVIFLETVAGIPGMVAGTLRHLTSLRRMRRDHGWIHTLLEEAENERMHLLTFLKLKQPGPIFRFAVLISQGVMFNAFFLAYIISPKTCHRFVGYIEEEAVHTYTVPRRAGVYPSQLLKDLDDNKLPLFSNLPAPAIAKSYWKLGDEAMFRDLVLAVRADEANHRVVNHTFADMHKEFKEDSVNPFSIHANVARYSDGGVKAPAVADIANGDFDANSDAAQKQQKEQQQRDEEMEGGKDNKPK